MSKKQLIMEKAIELFAKQGFEATSIQQITDHCGISKGAFYLAFKSKDELISALVDQFIEEFIANLDYVVNSSEDKEEMLYHFYYGIFDIFKNNANLGMLFVKEQAHSFNEEFINKFRNYELLFDLTILNMLDAIYQDINRKSKYDLMYSIKGLMSAYNPLFFVENMVIDIDRLARSLVEKTNLLATKITKPFVTEELYQLISQSVNEEVITKDKLVDLLNKTEIEVKDYYVKDSITILKEQIDKQTLSPVLIRGLIENIRSNPECKWLAYLLSKYYQV